jgi:Protein of unknown function (DUF3084)
VAADLPGIALVLAIVIVAGGIAYIGDRVGHQVGRKRLTLFGLRPKYTSTIVAVATGMLIALSVTLAALVGSNYVRTAFFRIGQLNAQINQLQAQAMAQQNELDTTRNRSIVMAKGMLIAPPALINLSLPKDQQLRMFSTFFDETVRSVNQSAPRVGLAKNEKRASDPEVRANLVKLLDAARESQGTGPVLFLPLAAENVFRGEPVTFGFGYWADHLLYDDGDAVASIDVDGGHQLAGPDYALLVRRSTDALAGRGMPPPFFAPPSGFDPVRFQAAMAQLARVRGRFRLVARSEGKVYPHTGMFILGVSVEPAG